ncbi:MAG: hypothetical protein JWR19_1027 [Pedosphaera sp.]|nr:hypothetical protein [Pedosphaera sp.]
MNVSLQQQEPPAADKTTTGIDAWFTPWRMAALLGCLIFVAYPEVILGKATFFFRDFELFGYPLAQYHHESFWRGELPLWNPLNNCGLPFLAQWNTLTLYPLSLFYLLLPLSWSLGMFCLGHLFLGGMGMYFLARRWTGTCLGASVAGMVFAFNGLTWHFLMWPNNISAFAWLPWVVLAMDRAWREGGRRIAIAALAGAMQMLTGAPEIIFLTWCLLGALWLMELFRSETSRARFVGRALAVGSLVAGLAAAQLLPFLDLLAHSQRDQGFSSDSAWAMPLAGLANFLVPLYRYHIAGHGVFVQFNQYWTSSYYVGVGVIALAALAVWRIRDRRVWFLVAVAILSVLMALGTQGGLYTLVKTLLPQLGFMRYPIKFIVPAVFALPLLAGYGASWWQSAAGNSATVRRSLNLVVSILLGLIVVVLLLARKYPLAWENWPMTWHNALGRAVVLLLLAGIFYLPGRAAHLRWQWLPGFALLCLLGLDVYTHAPRVNPTVRGSVYEPGLVRATMKLDPSPRMGEVRAMPTQAAILKASYVYLTAPDADCLCHRLALYDNCNLLDDIPKTDGFFSLYIREAQMILNRLSIADEHGADAKGMKDFLGIGYISAPIVSAAQGLDWTNRASALPLVTAGQKPVFADGTNDVAALLGAEFDPQQIIYLPTTARLETTVTNQVRAKVFPGPAAAQHLEFEVEAAAPALVSIAQAFYHPWRAYVDGKPVRLWRANHAFQALEVPAGRHQVKLVYEDRAFWCGAAISILCLLGCALGYARGKKTLPNPA